MREDRPICAERSSRKLRARHFLLSFALLAGGTAAGWAFQSWLDGIFAPAVADLKQAAVVLSAGPQAELQMLSFILAKNFSVVLLVLSAAPLADWVAGLERTLAVRFPRLGGLWPLSARLGRRFAVMVPALVLVVNGAMLAWSAAFFRSEGIPWAALAGGLAPHGVPELGALCLACGYALAAPAGMRRRLAFAARAVLPLLALAAAVEVFVSPAVMERFM